VLINALLEARDLLPQFFYLVLEIALPAPHAGIAGFEDGTQGVYGAYRGIAQKADREVEAAERRLAGRACGWGGREGPHGEAAYRTDGRPDKKPRRPLAQPKTPSGAPELRRGQV
jgi:hypothetical protein